MFLLIFFFKLLTILFLRAGRAVLGRQDAFHVLGILIIYFLNANFLLIGRLLGAVRLHCILLRTTSDSLALPEFCVAFFSLVLKLFLEFPLLRARS